MPVDAPKIDLRDQAKLVEQVQELVYRYCSSENFPEAWQKDLLPIQSDKRASALIHIFARMMEIIISRLNKSLDKNFLTFLDLIGVRQFPPATARAPLTFSMVKGATQHGLIPAGTQVATAEVKGQETVVFETEKALTVIVPELVKVVSVSPADNRWTDHSPVLFDKKEEGYEELFRGENLIFPHRLYIGHSKLFRFKEDTTITLKMEIGPSELNKLEVMWYYFDENSVPKPLEIEKTNSSCSLDTQNINLSITFKPVGGISEKILTGVEKESGRKNSWTNNWIFAELTNQVLSKNLSKIISVKDITVKVNLTNNADATINADATVKADATIDSKSPVIPDVAFFNNDLLDLSKDFYPFGERPKFNDTFYIGSKEVFSKKGETITMGVTLSTGVDAPLASEKRKLLWESWNGNDWEKIIVNYDFTGKKGNERIVTFTCPNTEEKEINGEKNRWIRVRIIEGNYGDEARYEKPRKFTGTGTIGYTKKNQTVTGNGTAFLNEIEIGDSIIVDTNCQIGIVTAIDSDLSLTVSSSLEDIPPNMKVPFSIGTIGWTYIPSTYKPPSISKLTLQYPNSQDTGSQDTGSQDAGSEEHPEVILAYNNFVYRNYTCSETFTPFQTMEDEKSTLYLAFDRNIATLPVTIFFPLIGKKVGINAGEAKKSTTLIGTGSVTSQDTNVKGFGTYFAKELKVGNSIVVANQTRRVTAIHSENSLTVDSAFERAIKDEIDFTYSALQEDSQEDPFLVWQYWTGKEWSELRVEDNTINLTKRELIQFLAPSYIAKKSCFGFESEYYWIRAKLEKGKYVSFPRLRAVHTNTVWARNQFTVQNEILGSSNGKPGQIFKLSRSSVLPGQKVLVMELSLTEEEKRIVINEEQGNDAIEEIKDNSDNVIGYWVRWHEVVHFYFSNPNSRHYTIDRDNGIITFGDGERGMIPPAERNNIKCSYKAGGGAAGNVKAGTITKLRTTFPYVDSVTNPEDADGGSDKESMNKVIERGPQTLKHRDRAVTYEDFVWLVKEASPKVVRVKCLPTTDISLRNQPGWITVVIVPESEDQKPVPSQQLINEIESYISKRTSTYLTSYGSHSSQINLIGPGYLKVWVETSVQFVSISEAKIIEGRVIDTLNKFFHPLYGGPEKKGWDFGRSIYISEVYEAIENTEGVDYVEDLKLNASAQIYKLTIEGMRLPDSYPKKSVVKSKFDTLLFDWYGISGNDGKEKFIKFLGQEYKLDWIETAIIEKTDNNIKVFDKNNSLSLCFNAERNKVTLKIDDDRTDVFVAINEYNKLNIYDGKIKLSLTKKLPEDTDIKVINVTGFKEGDSIIIRSNDKSVNLTVKSVSHESMNNLSYVVLECESAWIEDSFPINSTVETADKSIKSFTLNCIQAQTDISLTPVQIAIPEVEDTIVLIHAEKSWENASGKITYVDRNMDTIFVDENYLIYSGSHMINTK